MPTGPRRAKCALALAALLAMLTACNDDVTVSGTTQPGLFASAPASAPAPPPPPVGSAPSVKRALPAIQRFVEQERGLKFKHQVKLKLLGPKAFVKFLTKGDKPPSHKSINRQESVFASLGLVSPKVDLYKAFKSATDESTIGFYKFSNKRLYVKGTHATPGVRSVMAHELTHALDDQWFGLKRPALSKDNQERQMAFTALSEGDAERVRTAYEAKVLTADERAASQQQQSEAGGAPSDVPQVVLELIGFPYAIGPRFVEEVVVNGGLKALNRAFRHPPVSSEQLLDPTAYFDHDKPKHVATPKADRNRLEHGDLGLIGLLLMFEHGGVPTPDAVASVRGWGGDQFASWQAGKHKWCLRDTVVVDEPDGMTSFRAGLAQFAQNRPGKVTVKHQGSDKTTFTTCS